MDDTDLRSHSGIPLGHKFLALLLAGAAGAGVWYGLVYQSHRAASTAELAFDATLAQQVDPGISSARQPAVALAESLLTGPMVATLAKQAALASSTPAGQIGEFRSDLVLTEPRVALSGSPLASRLDVRFAGDDAAQALAANIDQRLVMRAD